MNNIPDLPTIDSFQESNLAESEIPIMELDKLYSDPSLLNNPKALDDTELNKLADSMYLSTEDMKGTEWKKVIKYLIIELDIKLDETLPTKFWIHNNRDLKLVQQGGATKTIELSPGKKMKQLVFTLLRSPEMVDNYRISLSVNTKSWGSSVYLKIFIHKNYLRQLCHNYCMAPEILSTVITDKGTRTDHCNVTTSDIPIAKNRVINDNEISYLNQLQIIPYVYQKNNVDWMYSIEKNVDLALNHINYLVIKNLMTYKLGGDQELYMDPESNIIYDEESLWNYKKSFQTVRFKGGVICDEAGLGKTLSMVALIIKNPLRISQNKVSNAKEVVEDTLLKDGQGCTIKKSVIIKKKPTILKKIASTSFDQALEIENKEEVDDINSVQSSGDLPITVKKELKVQPAAKSNDNVIVESKNPDSQKRKSYATLILCPSRLCQQWEDEIMKYMTTESYKHFTIIKITTKPQLEKQTYESLCDADIVIVSYPFIANKNYYNNQDTLLLDKIHWHRIIIDEGHEVLLPNARRKAEVQTCTTILGLFSTYRWVCTGDPLARTKESFEGIIAFLSGDKDIEYNKDNLISNLSDSIGKQILSTYFRRNTKKSTKDQIYIPGIKENITFLEFSPTERAVYDTAKTKDDTKRMMQLCTNILISDYDSNIIGNRTVNMSEINEAMSEHFKALSVELKDQIAANIQMDAQLDVDFPLELATIEKRIEPFQEMKKKKITLSTTEEEELEFLKESRTKLKSSYNYRKKAFLERRVALNAELDNAYEQVKLFTGLNADKVGQGPCPICQDAFKEIVITKCGHIFCHECFAILFENATKYANCPFCREHMLITDIKKAIPEANNKDTSKEVVVAPSVDIIHKEKIDTVIIRDQYSEILNKWGVKMAYLVKYLNEVFKDPSHRVIVFSQWNRMLNMVGAVLDEAGINHVYCRGNVWTITKSITRFKRDPAIRVIMLSSETCSSGSNLTEATHVILLDTVNTSKENALAIENQAVARAARLGQMKSVEVIRMIIKNTIEEEYYNRNYLSDKPIVTETPKVN